MKTTLKALLLASVFGGIASTAFAADLIVDAPPVYVEPEAASGGWDGPYIGFNFGYGSGASDHNDVVTTIGDMGMVGWLAGGQIGYNVTVAAGLVLGVEGALDWTNVTGTYVGPGPDITQTNNWEGSITGRIGFDAGAFMPYVLGGVAFVGTDRTSSFGPITESAIHTGYTVGVGAAAMVAENASIFGELRYNNFGNHTYLTLPSDPGVGLTSTEVRAGVNFHF